MKKKKLWSKVVLTQLENGTPCDKAIGIANKVLESYPDKRLVATFGKGSDLQLILDRVKQERGN